MRDDHPRGGRCDNEVSQGPGAPRGEVARCAHLVAVPGLPGSGARVPTAACVWLHAPWRGRTAPREIVTVEEFSQHG